MPKTAGTLEQILLHVGRALAPLEVQLAPGNVLALFAELGTQFPPALTARPGFAAAINSASTSAAALSPSLTQLAAAIAADDSVQITALGKTLVGSLGGLNSALDQVGIEVNAAAGALPGIPAPVVTAFAADLGTKLTDYMLVRAIESTSRDLANALSLTGIIDLRRHPGVDGDPTQPPYVERRLHLDRLGLLIQRPAQLAQDLYGWGTPAFDAAGFFRRLADYFALSGMRTTLDPAPPAVATSLTTPLFTVHTNTPGVLVDWTSTIPGGFDLQLPALADWTLHVHTALTLQAGLKALISPPSAFELTPPTGSLTGDMKVSVVGEKPAGDAFMIFGQTGGSRLQVRKVSASIGFAAQWDAASGKARGEPEVEASVEGGKAVIDMSKGDGFLQTLFSGVHVESDFGLQVIWKPSTGARLSGAAAIEIEIPTHVNLGPVELQALYLRAGLDGSGIPLEVSANVGATLGPLQVAIERIGLQGALTFPAHGGNLGRADLQLRFKAPVGLGIAVDAGVVTGGGFISYDEPNGRYAGILQLRAAGIGVTAIGLLDTRLPGGAAGYSFLIIVAVNLPPIQLGFGFTLTGIGGLAGINRTVITDAITQGLRTGVLDHIMFPPDPIKNAPQIISDLRNIFPPAADRYVFGPMLQLAWGTPSLIVGQLGVLLEVPDPIRLILIGQLKMALPAEDVALVEIHVDLLGILDFGQKLLMFMASMHDSRVTIYSVYGDMAMRLYWGDPPNFALSMGGWNPHFTPPPGMPELRRLTVALGLGDNPRLTCQSYFAVTSNSFQFGAKVEAYAEAAGFNIHGWIGFDALVIFSPFSFIVDISAGVELRRGTSVIAGIHLSAELSGPNPWHVKGEACLSLFFFDICVPVNFTIGDKKPEALPTADPWPLLEAAIKKPESWTATLPPGGARAVSLSIPAGSAPPLLVDPLGGIELHEKVLPLNKKITKFGEAKPIGPDRYDISSVLVGGSPASSWTARQDYFASGQFQELSDAEKLSRPSFELMDAGVKVGSDAVAHGGSMGLDMEYETIIVDAPDVTRFAGIYTLTLAAQMSMIARGAVAKNGLARDGMERYKDGPAAAKRFADTGEKYAVASTVDMRVRADVAEGVAMGAAHDLLADYLEANPSERGLLHVVPLHELEVAA